MKNNLFPSEGRVTQTHRVGALCQRPVAIWFTGLSGSGKSTLANYLEFSLHNRNYKTYLLDSDNIRTGLNKDLDFSNEARSENLRRVAEVSKLFLDSGLVVLAAFISPFENDRKLVKQIIGEANVIEVFVDCPLSVCEQRDVKGLYRNANAGRIKNFTGISSPYEKPSNPNIVIPTDLNSVSESVEVLLDYILPKIML